MGCKDKEAFSFFGKAYRWFPGKFCLAVVAMGVLEGCAGITVTRVDSDDRDQKDVGFRFYEGAPYLLVYTDSKGGLISSVIYLPDQTKKVAAKPYAYAASNDTTLTFTNGILSGADSVADGTAVPNAVIGAIQIAASAGAAALLDARPPLPGPRLYKLVKVNGVLKLAGGKTDPETIPF